MRGDIDDSKALIFTLFWHIFSKLFKYLWKFPLSHQSPTFFLPKLMKKLKFRPHVLFPTNVGTLQNLVAWTLGVIACRWDTEQITPKSETLKCPLVRGRHSVYLWLQESKNSRGHLPYTGGSAMPALCLTEKRTQLSREPIPWLSIVYV